MIRNTSTLCSIASALIKCIQDTENVRHKYDTKDSRRYGDLGLSREIETRNGVAVHVLVDMAYGYADSGLRNYDRSSISIKIYNNRTIFKISFKYLDDDWKLDTFYDDLDKNNNLLNAASEALIEMMMDMVHATSIFTS